MKIPAVQINPKDDPWEHMDGPELPVLEIPCGDCAVECGFYLPFTKKLKRECTPERQLHVAKRWFCHNDKTKACRGNWNALGLAAAAGNTNNQVE